VIIDDSFLFSTKKIFHPRGTKDLSVVPPEIHISEGSSGPEGARTPDLIHAMDALFQLRYRPMLSYW
jgi:hypothetical protein